MPRVVARVNHPKNEWLFNENWGVDLSVSTPHLITALVEEAVSVGRLVRILQFEGGNVRLVEVTLAENAPVVDQRDPRPRHPARRHHRRGGARRARGDAARRHGVRVRRRGARDGHERQRGRRPPDPHRGLRRPSGRAGSSDELVERVVHEVVARLATVPGDHAVEDDTASRRDSGDLATTEKHRSHRCRGRRRPTPRGTPRPRGTMRTERISPATWTGRRNST